MNQNHHCGLRIADCGLGRNRARGASGSVLIIVMWIAFGVVSLALYFGHSMEMNMRAADNQLASEQSDQAIEAGALYYSNVLANMMQLNTQGGMMASMQPYMLPPTNYYQTAGVKVGEARFWVIGRDTNDAPFSHRSPDPLFGLVDEASKVNLNNTKVFTSPDSTKTTNLLQNLPQMTFPLLCAIYDWTSPTNTPSSQGAKSQTYEGLNPPYMCKMTNFDTIGELRMVYGMNLDLLYNEDINQNGALDPNENDGQTLPPNDNNNGMLDPGFLEYLTVYTHEPTNYGITNRVSVANTTALTAYIQTNFPSIYSQISTKLRTMTAPTSVLDFAVKSGITESDFINIEPFLMGPNTVGLVNINTAPAAALACVPGIGWDGVMGLGSATAQSIVTYRQGNPSRLNSIYWIIDAMANAGTNAILAAGPWITSRSFQYSADIAAVGRYGRGYRRVRFVFDCSGGVPQIVYRQDLTYLGWALGKKIHDQLLAGTLK